jgi:hypothetical protein
LKSKCKSLGRFWDSLENCSVCDGVEVVLETFGNNRRQVIKTTVARLLEDFILLVKLLREY